MMHMRKVVDGLMQKCEGIGERMQAIITQLTGATQLQDIADTDNNYIRNQSELLNERWVYAANGKFNSESLYILALLFH